MKEYSFRLESVEVKKPRKLIARWTPELAVNTPQYLAEQADRKWFRSIALRVPESPESEARFRTFYAKESIEYFMRYIMKKYCDHGRD